MEPDARVTVLVTGATGYIGRSVVAHLVAHGTPVRCLVMPEDPFELPRSPLVEVVRGDVTAADALADAGDDVDTVIHSAAVMPPARPELICHVNVEGTRRVLEQVKRWALTRCVHLSAVSATYRPLNAYGASKLEAEELVRASGLPYTILRPTMVYGPGGGLHFQKLVGLVRRSPGVLPVIGPGTQRLQPVALDDVVAAIDLARGHPAAIGKTYGVSGRTVATFDELADRIAAALGRSRVKLHVPLRLCRPIARVAGRFAPGSSLTPDVIAGLTQDATLDWEEFARDCGYSPLSLATGLERALSETDA
jgi:NADH dehydrogenase